MVDYVKGSIVGKEPLTAEEAAEAIRLDVYDNAEIERLIAAAREAAEDFCNTDFVIKEYMFSLDTIPGVFEVEKRPLQEIKAAKVYDEAGEHDITSEYVKISGNRIFRTGKTEFAALRAYDPVEITVEVGYGTTSPKVTEAIIWHCYNNYYKQPAQEWLPQFKALLADIRRWNI